MANHRRARANAMLAIAAAAWGFGFVAQRQGADHVGPMSFNAVRFLLAALFVCCVILFRNTRRHVTRQRRRSLLKRALGPGVLVGLVLAVAGGLQQAGMSDTTAGQSAFVTGLYMVLVPLVGMFLGNRMRWPILVGVVLAVAGLYLICVKDGLSVSRGNLLTLASAFCWTAHILLLDRFSKNVSTLRLAATQFVTCAVASAIASPIFDAQPFAGLQDAVIPLAYGGFVAGGIAFTLQVVAQRDALAAHAALLMALESVFGAIGGALLLGENMGVRGYSGAALMVVGIAVSQFFAAKNTPAPVSDS